jgi:hypothetical protein
VSAGRDRVVVTHQPVHSIINQRAIGGKSVNVITESAR